MFEVIVETDWFIILLAESLRKNYSNEWSLKSATVKVLISTRKIKCRGCNSRRKDVYCGAQHGAFCTDCLKKKYRELLKEEVESKQKTQIM